MKEKEFNFREELRSFIRSEFPNEDRDYMEKKIDDIFKEFIRLLKEQINEWEYYEKRFPHKETKWNRIKARIDKLAGDKLT